MNNASLPKVVPSAIGIGLLLWFGIPVPEKVSPEAWHLLALFIGTTAHITAMLAAFFTAGVALGAPPMLAAGPGGRRWATSELALSLSCCP